MKTAFIIRMHYKHDDPRWPWRKAYFESMVLPRLLAQTDQDFDICIRANILHMDELEAMSEKIKTFDVKSEKRDWIKPGYEQKAKRYHVDFVNFSDTVGLDRYDIQIGLDSDDLIIRDDFVEKIKKECESAEGTLHLSFQPYMFHVPTLRTYRCALRYSGTKGSPFFALYQPKERERVDGEFVFAYEDSHLKLHQYMDETRTIEDGYCAFSIHDKNASTYLYAGSKQILI